MSLIMEAGRKIELGPLEEFPSRLEEIFQPFSEPEGVITIKAGEREIVFIYMNLSFLFLT